MGLTMAVTATALSLFLLLAAGLCHGVSGGESINGDEQIVHKEDGGGGTTDVGQEKALSEEHENGGSDGEGNGVSGSDNGDESANNAVEEQPSDSSVDGATDLHDNSTESPE